MGSQILRQRRKVKVLIHWEWISLLVHEAKKCRSPDFVIVGLSKRTTNDHHKTWLVARIPILIVHGKKKNLNPTTNHHATMVLAACWTAGTKLHSPPKADIWSLIMKNLWKSLEISMPLMPCNNEQIISDILLSCQTHLFWGCQGTQLLAGLPGGFNPWNFLWRFPTPWYKWKPLHVPNKVCKCLQKWNAK